MFPRIRRFLTGLVSESVREANNAVKAKHAEALTFKERLTVRYQESQEQLATVTQERDAAARDANSTRGELAALKEEYDVTCSALKVSEAENERLWNLAERDRERISREIAMHNRRRAEHQAAPDKQPEE